jgi:hypothetical protein
MSGLIPSASTQRGDDASYPVERGSRCSFGGEALSLETEWRADAFEGAISASWLSSVAWQGIIYNYREQTTATSDLQATVRNNIVWNYSKKGWTALRL